MNHHHALRLTPSNSPFYKTATPKSPTKSKSEEPGLRLKKVIGTTTASANGFDCLPSARQFAYTSGAAGVVCTVDDELMVIQRFFRARPGLPGGWRDFAAAGAISPGPNEARSRVLGNLRDSTVNGSPLGASVRDYSDSPTGKTATAKDRVKAATSVALSPNGKWVAMGETGYKPRILIFSNKGESSEIPVCALAEHTFGVHALAFSPDSKYLASLGTVNDGFLYIWSIDDRTGAAALHSSNKCTNTINAMTWIGRSVLTVGVRCVRLWRPGDDTIPERRGSETTSNISTPRQKASDFGNSILSPKHKFLPGKSSLLNELIESNFVAALAISDDKAVVCAETGQVCVIEDCQAAQNLTSFATTDFRISSAAFDGSSSVIVSGGAGQSKTFQLNELEQRTPTSARRLKRQTMSPLKSLFVDANPTLAMATFQGITVELDSRRGIRLSRSKDPSQNDADLISHQLAAHNEAVLGVLEYTSDALPQAAFLTFSTNGWIQIWDVDGAVVATLQVPVQSSAEMYDLTNELRAVRPLHNTSYLAAGDKYGTLSLLDVSTGNIITQVRAHSTEVVDIVTLERPSAQFIATASRDRTIQLFVCIDAKLELLQTMDEHAAAVSSLLLANGSEMLLSCSADRTVVVRKIMARRDDPTAVAFDIIRTITLKSSPTSMCLGADGDDLLVATVDRCVSTYSIKNGQAGFSFKCSDTEGGEAAALSKIIYAPSLNGNPTIIGVSSGDKSVRLYSEYGSLIARDWGHTEGITDVVLLQSQASESDEQGSRAQIVTVAADSTIFMWDTISQAINLVLPSDVNGTADTPVANKLTTPMGPPLRKVLSFSELSRFRRESSYGEGELSPSATNTPTQQPPPPPSPPRLKKKTSRMSVAQPPRLEPAFRSSFAEPARRRKRSPSPPSPRGTGKKDSSRKASLGMSLRSKSSENVLSSYAPANNTGFGSVTSHTESVCRTLRAYRKKLTNSSTSDTIAPDVMRELEKELKLTARVVGEKSQGKNLDEAMMTKLLDQASEKIVSRLDERIKERVESEVRKSGEGSPSGVALSESPKEMGSQEMDAVVGALEKVAIEKRDGA